MAKTAKFSLKLLIDEEKNKVVLAEAGQEFVDVLFSLLTLPMGTIARLLERHQKLPSVLGCYKNLNKSVADMVIDDFETEACKSMLLYPKSTKEIYCRRLKLNIDDTVATKFFVCYNFYQKDSCRKVYSNYNTSRCSCGSLMSSQVQVPEDEQVLETSWFHLVNSFRHSPSNAVDGVFVSCRSSFIITDDMKVSLNSIDEIVKVVNGQGYPGLSDLREMLLEVGSQEVLTLLANIFVSESPLTCTLLRKHCMKKVHKPLFSQLLKTGRVEHGTGCYVKVFVGKLDRKVFYAECSEDFIDSLLTFLVLPLELASSFPIDNTILGCVRNLCTSGCRRGFVYGCSLPGYYTCSKNLLDVRSYTSPRYQCLIPEHCYYSSSFKFSKRIERSGLSKGQKVVAVDPMEPNKSRSGTPMTVVHDIGFVKRKTKFIVSDELIITPMNKFSTVGLLKKMQINMNDLDTREIPIYKAELINILNASLTSSSALTNGLSYLLAKEPKKET